MHTRKFGAARVEKQGGWRLIVPAGVGGYTDAQLDDYGGLRRRAYPWRPPVKLTLRARFSVDAQHLVGTAGFGFWNAPIGDATTRIPTWPQATWFFYASAPNNLPFLHGETGWFAATIDTARWRTWRWLPLALHIVLLNQIPAIRRRLWSRMPVEMGISCQRVTVDMSQWHTYSLRWEKYGCEFRVDGRPILRAPHSPRGPLGFVCWIDNQYMVATPRGRVTSGILLIDQAQWLNVTDIRIR